MTRLVAILSLIVATSTTLVADGGLVLLQRETPAFVIVVFGSPVPIRAGILDLSVMVQDTGSKEPVLDAVVSVEVRGNRIPATHHQAQNKLLYAAAVELVDAGSYDYSVQVERNGSSATASGVIFVAPRAELPAYTAYFLLPPVGVALFAFHQRLRRRNRARA